MPTLELCRVGWGFRNQRHSDACHAALSERFEEREELVVRTVSGGLGRGSGDGASLFLEAQIDLDVDLRRIDSFMPEPQRDHRFVNAIVQQFHRGVAAQSRSSHR